MPPRLAALSLLLLAGCSSTSLSPMNPTALPAQAPLPTVGGYQLELDTDGTLVYRPAQGDIEAALGVTLEQGAAGLVVSGLLDAASGLRPGDVLLRVRPVNPLAIDYREYEARAEAERQDYLARRAAGEKVPLFFTGTYEGAADVAPLETSSLARYGAEVHTVEDMRGFSLSWTGLDLLVVRGGEPLALRHEVGKPHLIPQRLWHPDWTRRQGFTAIRVDTLPPHLRPQRAPGELHDTDLLVTWVAEQSPLALQGLRPLALIRLRGDDVDDLVAAPASVRLPERRGAHIEVDFTPPGDPTDLTLGWVVADVESDPIRTTWSLAAGYLFQYASAYAYNPRLDDYVQSWACTIGSTAISISGVWDSNQTQTSTMTMVLGSTHIETEVDQGGLLSGPFAFAWDGSAEDLDEDVDGD